MPELLVDTVMAPVELEKRPLGPACEGAVKVTSEPLYGLPKLSATLTESGVGNGLPAIPLWLFPPLMESTGAPGELVRVKVAGLATPTTDAVTEYAVELA